MFISYIFTDFRFYIFWIAISMFSTCIHEFAHAVISYWQGDDTAKLSDRFNLNPIVHMGPVSLCCLMFFGLCWGLCPVNPMKFKHDYSNALVALAGPLSNIVIAIIFGILYCFLSKYTDTSIVMNNLIYFCWIGAYSEFVIAIFNLIPVSPLDGSKIFEYLIPQLKPVFMNIGHKGLFVVFLVFFIFEPLNEIFWGSGAVFVDWISKIYMHISSFIH